MNLEYFTVKLAPKVSLGIPLEDMGSVIQLEKTNICTVPGVPSFWYGVANFKGSLLWILDSQSFFNLEFSQRSSQKLTAVILQNQQSKNQNRVALVTQQLQGIISVESSRIKTSTDNISWSRLKASCSGIAQSEAQEIYLINPLALLQQLHQQSSLVSA